MIIKSRYEDDTRHQKNEPGAYEWWYFDFIQQDGPYQGVIIFYDGNPFSPRYYKQLNRGADARADDYPAVSISIYRGEETVYYSFTEFEQHDFNYEEKTAGFSLSIGPHQLQAQKGDGKFRYTLYMNETLASGDALRGKLLFFSDKGEHKELLTSVDSGNQSRHMWNLAQPKARVEGSLNIYSALDGERIDLSLNAKGYHDHNLGMEPLDQQFAGWYWGRFHFKAGTLVYYLMQRKQDTLHHAWLLSAEGGTVKRRFEKLKADDTQRSLFGLISARHISLDEQGFQLNIYMHHLVDNGPFYQRFIADGVLHQKGGRPLENTVGFCEYIHPPRINNRWLSPLVNMRLRYSGRDPHWVQKSPRLYRWTW